MKFRISADRISGKKSENSCNYALITYFIKYDSDSTEEEIQLHISKAVKSALAGFEKTTKDQANINNVNRTQVFLNREDNYYSINNYESNKEGGVING